jgi:hypothetical protein
MKKIFLLFFPFALLATGSAFGENEQISDLQRATGLWKIVVTRTPLVPVEWHFCAVKEKDHILHSDIWRYFEKECKVNKYQRNENRYVFSAACKDGFDLEGEVKGNLLTDYSVSVSSTYTYDNEEQVDYYELNGEYVGECPDDLPPGSKRMYNNIILEGFYDD